MAALPTTNMAALPTTNMAQPANNSHQCSKSDTDAASTTSTIVASTSEGVSFSSTTSTLIHEDEEPINLLENFDPHAGPYGEVPDTFETARQEIFRLQSRLVGLSKYDRNPAVLKVAADIVEEADLIKRRTCGLITRQCVIECTRLDQVLGEALARECGRTAFRDEIMRCRLRLGRQLWARMVRKEADKSTKWLEDSITLMRETMQLFKLVNEEGYEF